MSSTSILMGRTANPVGDELPDRWQIEPNGGAQVVDAQALPWVARGNVISSAFDDEPSERYPQLASFGNGPGDAGQSGLPNADAAGRHDQQQLGMSTFALVALLVVAAIVLK